MAGLTQYPSSANKNVAIPIEVVRVGETWLYSVESGALATAITPEDEQSYYSVYTSGDLVLQQEDTAPTTAVVVPATIDTGLFCPAGSTTTVAFEGAVPVYMTNLSSATITVAITKHQLFAGIGSQATRGTI